MPFNVDNFIGSLSKYGTLQTNKFEVEIPLPEFLKSPASANPPPQDLLHMRAERVRLPGIVLDTIESRRYGIGPLQRSATNVRFEPIDISFIETFDSKVYKIFNDWIRVCMFDFSGTGNGTSILPTFLAEYKDSYRVDITIHVYNNGGTNPNNPSAGLNTPVKKIKLIEAFPISIGDNDLSWSDTNILYKVNVTFAYSYHQLITT